MSTPALRLLEHYVALDLTDLRGQFCGKCLEGLGMEVIKIEPPGGDPVRRMGPFKDDVPHLEGSLRFAYLNAGKKGVTLELGHAEGRALFLRLVEQADVVLESFDPGTLDRMGLGPDVLRQRNPRLVVTSVTSFGQDGPYRDFLAPDLVNFALGGLMFIAGDPAHPPVNAPETQGFYYPAIFGALGTVAALLRREQSGRGEHVDIAAQEALATQEHLLRIFGSLGKSVERQGSQHPFAAPANIFPTKDGHVFLFASRAHWPNLLKVWDDHPKEFEQPEWLPDNYRRERMERVNAAVSAFTGRFTKEEFALLMQKNGIPCLPVNAPGEFARDEQLEARELLGLVEHAHLGAYRQVGFPVLVDGNRAAHAPPPLLGQHTAALLTERLGLSAGELQTLFAQAVI
jgi:crotonobetainyl-CoA:carnitine CoA-transferase CaiB-like acyl-CoA transferase